MHKGWHQLTAKQRRQILRLSSHLSQREIAENLGIHRNSVSRTQRAAGISLRRHGPRRAALTDQQEKAVLKLLRVRRTQVEIVEELPLVSDWQVRQTAKKFGISNRRWEPTVSQLKAITDLALAHQHSGAAIAKKVGSPYKPTMKIIHEVLQCERFLTGPKLDSFLPMKWSSPLKKATAETEKQAIPAAFIQFVTITTRILGDRDELPADLTEKVRMIVGLCLRTIPQAVARSLTPPEQQQVIDVVTEHTRQAIEMLEGAGNGLVN
jgi:hypothetical protein